MSFKFAIIGGGLTGTTMLYQLVERLRQDFDQYELKRSNIKIQVFEKQQNFGPGFPHNSRNVMSFHITNMCAKDMGIVPGNAADFQEWVFGQQNSLNALFPGLQDAFSSNDRCNHYPRAIMGEYLKARFKEAHHSAERIGLAVDLYSSAEVIDIEEKQTEIHLTVRDIKSGSTFSIIAHRVLLATGHWFEEMKRNRYFPSPWPAKRLIEKIPEGERIAVIGTSLSAIEVVLTLTSDGQFIRDDTGELAYRPPKKPRRFTLYSRKGLLPRARGRMGTYRNMFLTRDKLEGLMAENRGLLKLDDVFQLLNSELEAAYGHEINWQAVISPTQTPSDLLQQYIKDAVNGDGADGELIWQTVLHQSFDMIREIYLRLSLEERERFDKNYTSVFFTHAATQPIYNAEKMLALMKSGFVDLFKLVSKYQLIKNDDNDVYEFIYKDNTGAEHRDIYRYVVSARGQAVSIETDPSDLMRNLLRRGTVQIEEIQEDQLKENDCNVPARHSKKQPYTYKTGSIWIDPQTHQVVRAASSVKGTKSKRIYAVGAMTRGQIIDASMAHGIVQSTACIADSMVDDLRQLMEGINC